jgi:hypothetical protein
MGFFFLLGFFVFAQDKKKKKKKKKKDTLQGGIGYLVLMSIFGFLED